jgi:hypothetical protein
MSLNLAISTFFCLLVSVANAQKDAMQVDNQSSKFKFLYDDSRQRLGSVSLSYQMPITTGSNFIGSGFKGRNGYNFKIKVFPYKHFFIGFAEGTSQFDVVQLSILGNYTSSRIAESFFYVGYEFLPLKNVRLGVHTSIGGRIVFSNAVPNSNGNRDTGNLSSFGFNIDYEFIKNLAFFAEYAFRQMKSNILVPEALQSTFEKGTYNTINVGLRFSFGNKDLFGQFFN